LIHFFFFKQKTAYEIGLGIPAEPLFRSRKSRNVTLIILTLSVSRLLNLLLRLVAFLLFLNPQCLASISRWITASSSWKRFCLFEIGRASCRERVYISVVAVSLEEKTR